MTTAEMIATRILEGVIDPNETPSSYHELFGRIVGEMDDNNVHTSEIRSLKFNPANHRAFITPIADGNQMIDVLPTDHPQPLASREIEPVE